MILILPFIIWGLLGIGALIGFIGIIKEWDE